MITLDPFSGPKDIERRSFAIIDEEVGEPKPFQGPAWEIARRLVHTTGDFSLLADLVLPDSAVASGREALLRGAPIFTDTEMVRAGIPRRRLEPFGNRVECVLARAVPPQDAPGETTTRSRAGMLSLGEQVHGSIVAVGNAPTALLALLELCETLRARPSLVIGMPVGFVNAAQSKELLLQRQDIPSLVLRGRRGGSPLAAATVNALACLAGHGKL